MAEPGGLRRKIIGGALLAMLVALVLAAAWIAHVAALAPVTPVRNTIALPRPRPDVPRTGNPANDRLADLPSTEQALVLGKKIGQGCVGTVAYPMGIGHRDADRGDAYWSVKCADGKAYAVALHADKEGSASVIPCDAMASAGMTCFQHLPR